MLIETVLYVSLTTIMAAAMLGTIWNILRLSSESARYQAASLELARVGKRIEYLIRTADSVNLDASDQLSLGQVGSSQVTRVFLENGVLVVDDGSADALSGDVLGISGFHAVEYFDSGSAARYISFEIFGSTRFTSDAFPLVLHGGAEARSLFIE